MKANIPLPALFRALILMIAMTAVFIFATSCSKKEDPEPGLTITSFLPLTGTTGTVVTISGASFDETKENNTVSFNKFPGVVTAATATQLTVTVPDGASSGKIEVTTNGKTVTSKEDFTITP
ncbi:MAG: hypothetical protein HOP08_05500 [Cyclobacteriaceae bacterium]|nr:hypothetical protein [Cyclobacteriaceae bacterium]